MRYVQLRIAAVEGRLHTVVPRELPEGVGRGPIRQVQLLDDGTAVQLRVAYGDTERLEAALLASEDVLRVATTSGPTCLLFTHYEPTPATRDLLSWRTQHPVVVEPPVAFDGDDVLVTLVGDVSRFAEATASLPVTVTYDVLGTGERDETVPHPFADLTERQREILATAVELGYYQNPREATQADVAATLSLSPGTVGAHLRKIEARVFSAFDPAGGVA